MRLVFFVLGLALLTSLCWGCAAKPSSDQPKTNSQQKDQSANPERTGQFLVAPDSGTPGKTTDSPAQALIEQKDLEFRQDVDDVLTQLGPEAEAAIPKLAKLLEEEDPNTRFAAAKALGQIGPEAREAIPILKELLNDRHVSRTASEALKAINAEGATSAP